MRTRARTHTHTRTHIHTCWQRLGSQVVQRPHPMHEDGWRRVLYRGQYRGQQYRQCGTERGVAQRPSEPRCAAGGEDPLIHTGAGVWLEGCLRVCVCV